jgi:hypothetical protein
VSIATFILARGFWIVSLIASVLALPILCLLVLQMRKAKKLEKAAVPGASDASEEAAQAMVSLLNKQNHLVDEWKNTIETRDKLKLLKISSNSQQS